MAVWIALGAVALGLGVVFFALAKGGDMDDEQ